MSAEEHAAFHARALQAGLQSPQDYLEVCSQQPALSKRQTLQQCFSRDIFCRMCKMFCLLTPVCSVLQVQLAHIDCLRRKGQAAYAKTREAFEAAQELLSIYFPDWVDRSLQLTAYRADCALRLGDGIEEARAVWNAALKTAAGRYCRTAACLPSVKSYVFY